MCIAMKKMAASNVLIIGLQGLGAEIGNPNVNKHSPNKLTNIFYSQECLFGGRQVCDAV
jgi:hypothetical protein